MNHNKFLVSSKTFHYYLSNIIDYSLEERSVDFTVQQGIMRAIGNEGINVRLDIEAKGDFEFTLKMEQIARAIKILSILSDQPIVIMIDSSNWLWFAQIII